MRFKSNSVTLAAACVLTACSSPSYDVIIRDGTIVDGTGSPGFVGDVAIVGDSIVAVGDIGRATAPTVIDASGKVVAPGFINMLSWATDDLIEDGDAMSDVLQGVTLEVFGEGWSEGPLTESMKENAEASQGDIEYDIQWTTLGEYLEYLEERGVSVNVASFVGATTLRIHEIGYNDRSPTEAELSRMQDLVRQAMREGALGLGSSLIYAPAFYASTEELIALATAAGEFGGMYISHMRSEGDRLIEAVGELIRIATEAGVPAEIYHLKAAGASNWHKLDSVIAMVEEARSNGVRITADMYTYTAGATGLDAAMPPWVQEGGFSEWVRRLQNPRVRARVVREMSAPGDGWENLYAAAGSADQLLLVGFRADSLRYLTGRTLAEVAEMRGTSPEETAIDLVIQNGADVGTVYFLMSEENVERQVGLPWLSFGSDAGAKELRPPFTNSSTHPRAYGNFARLMGKYVRDEGATSLESAIHRLTDFPATNLGIRRRGRLSPGYHADVVVFDPAQVQDHATFEEPHQYSTGVTDVFVNGAAVLLGGEHTGAHPGRVVRGPGWEGWDR